MSIMPTDKSNSLISVYCIKCKTSLDSDYTFCPKCGAEQSQPVKQDSVESKIVDVINTQGLLGPCSTCSQLVSPNAVACPHCGQPMKPEDLQSKRSKSSPVQTALGVFCGILLVSGVMTMISGVIGVTSYTSPMYEAQTKQTSMERASRWYDPIQKDYDLEVGRLASKAKLDMSVFTIICGLVFISPFCGLVIARNRASRR